MVIFNILCLIILWNLISSIFYLKNKPKQLTLYCGIIGFSGKNKFNKDKIIHLIMWNTFERGLDATGVYSPKNGLIKTIDNGFDFVQKNNILEDDIFMAHVRAATVGDKTKVANAHPFQYNGVTFLHNGTLRNHQDLMYKHELKYADFSVDSQVIAGIIGKEQNFNVISEIDGPAAFLIHHDKTPNILYAFRNSERPLFRGMIGEDMYISSIKESLKLIGCTKIKDFKENYLYAIKDGKIIDYRAVKNTPYHSFTHTKTNFKVIYPVNMLIGTILPLLKKGYWETGLTVGKKYLVVGFNMTNQYITIQDDNLEYRDVSKFDFDYEKKVITEDCYVKALCDLVLGSGKNEVKIASKGDYFKVTTNNIAKCTVKAFKLNDPSISTVIPKNLIERVDSDEEDYIVEKYTTKIENQLVLNFLELPEGTEAPELLDNFEDVTDLDMGTSIEEQPSKEEKYPNLIVVDRDDLISDFINIEERYERLFKYVSPLLTEESLQVIQKERVKTMDDFEKIAERHDLLTTNTNNNGCKKLLC